MLLKKFCKEKEQDIKFFSEDKDFRFN